MRLLRLPNYRQTIPLAVLAAITLIGGSSVAAETYVNTVLNDKPIAYYRLEELPGAVIAQDSGPVGLFPGAYGYSGLYPELGQPGIDTNSISLSAAQTAAVTAGYYTDLNPQGPFSFEIWVRPTSVPTGGDYRCPIGNFGGWGTGGGSGSGWYVYQTPGPGSTLAFIMAHSPVWISTDYSLFKWYHLVGTYDGTSASFYVNGVQIGSPQAATGWLANPAQPLAFGQRADGYGYWDGNLDEVAIYTNALTLAQVQTHYQVGTNSFRAGPVPAAIRQDPTSTTNYAGHSAQFTVLADGTPPLAYQWYKGSSSIPGATTTILSFTCKLADDATSYSVIVTNNSGSATSAVATLTVSTNLLIKSQPASIIRNDGTNSTAAFLVVAEGALPITNQWYKGSTPILGATNQTLWLTGLQVADSGNTYYARVGNPYTFTNSDPATLTVQARPVTVPIARYAKVVMADHPVAYWRLDEAAGSTTAVDAAGSFDGSYNPGSGSFTFGSATGIPHETDTAVGLTGGATINIPYALELNPWGPFTFEGWFQPASLAADGNDYRTPFSSMFNSGGVGPTGWLLYQQGNNTWSWWPYAGNWASAQLPGGPELIVPNQWYYIALTYDGSIFTTYVNAQAKSSGAYPAFVQNGNVPAVNPNSYHYTYDGSGPTVLGWRSDAGFNPFLGAIDDVAVYNQALTPQQIQQHYSATVRLTITPGAGNTVILSWPFGTLQQADQVTGLYTDMTTATSPHTNSVALSPKFYRVKVQ